MNSSKPSQQQLDTHTVRSILSKITIFAALSEEQLGRLFAHLAQVSYKKDDCIFKQGEEPSSIYVIESGSVVIGLEDGPQMLELARLGVGECFGETSVIGIQSHSASAVALEDTTLIVLSRRALFEIFEQDKELFAILILNIAREACRRLHKTDEIVLHYMSSHKK